MKVCWARQYPVSYLDEPSIFLAGPTPREPGIAGWRKEALDHLGTFSGTVFVPENDAWGLSDAIWADQVRWEWAALDAASVILFWIPRDLETLPGFTTNIEFGMFVKSDPHRVLVGGPPGAPKNAYPKMLAKRFGVPWYDSLRGLCISAEILAKRLSTP